MKSHKIEVPCCTKRTEAAGIREGNLCLYEEIISSLRKALITVYSKKEDYTGGLLKSFPNPFKTEFSTRNILEHLATEPTSRKYSRIKDWRRKRGRSIANVKQTNGRLSFESIARSAGEG